MTKREVAEYLGVTKERVQAMVRQGQLSPETRKTELDSPYLWFDRAEVEELRRKRDARAAGERPKGTAGPAPKAAPK